MSKLLENFNLNVTDLAANKAKNIIKEENNPNLKLRIYIKSGGCSGLQYLFALDDKLNDDDFIIKKNGISLVVDSISIQYLVDGSIDYIEELESSRFIFNNHNAKSICSCGSSFSI